MYSSRCSCTITECHADGATYCSQPTSDVQRLALVARRVRLLDATMRVSGLETRAGETRNGGARQRVVPITPLCP